MFKDRPTVVNLIVFDSKFIYYRISLRTVHHVCFPHTGGGYMEPLLKVNLIHVDCYHTYMYIIGT